MFKYVLITSNMKEIFNKLAYSLRIYGFMLHIRQKYNRLCSCQTPKCAMFFFNPAQYKVQVACTIFIKVLCKVKFKETQHLSWPSEHCRSINVGRPGHRNSPSDTLKTKFSDYSISHAQLQNGQNLTRKPSFNIHLHL